MDNRLTDDHLRRCQNELAEREFAGSLELVRKVVETDPGLVERLVELYSEPYQDGHGLDTWEREMLMDAFAQLYAGRCWPCNSEVLSGQVSDNFVYDLVTKSAADGWTGTTE